MAMFEVPPDVARRCLADPWRSGVLANLDYSLCSWQLLHRPCSVSSQFLNQSSGSSPRPESPTFMMNGSSPLFVILDVFVGEGALSFLPVKDWGRLLRVSKLSYDKLQRATFWVRGLGFTIPKLPSRDFSPLKLFHLMMSLQKHSDWERKIMSTAVSIKRNPGAVTPLVISLTGEESLAVWENELVALLKLAQFPTVAQTAQLSSTLDFIFEKGGTSNKILDFALAIPKPNRIFMVVLAFQLVNRQRLASLKEKKPETSNYLVDYLKLSELIPDIKSILYFVAIWNGIAVDKLKEPKWKLQKKNLNNTAKKAILRSLQTMSWLALSDAFKFEPLFKVVAKNIHLGALIGEAIAKKPSDVGLIQLRLFFHCLHTTRYPKTAKEFELLDWLNIIVKPFRRICETNPLFGIINPKFLSLEFNPKLAGKELPRPAKRTVEAALAQLGNKPTTWDYLFRKELVTVPQVLLNLRSLILMHYPMASIGKLVSSNIKLVSPCTLLKLRQMILSTFPSEFVDDIKKTIRYYLGEHSFNEADETIRLKIYKQSYRDGKGHVIERSIEREVYFRFGEGVVEKYTKLVDSLITYQALRFVPIYPIAKTRAVIAYTPDLRNFIRSGMPPTIPNYSRTSLWRNEGVCLQQLGLPGESFEELKVGVTWCEGPGRGTVDLDLTALIYDSDWALVDFCSYKQLNISGMRHSGDLKAAPYPHGAREMVNIRFPTLMNKYKKARFIVLMVNSFRGHDMSDLYDASVFVAHPYKAGTGPGGMEIISAARLTGKGAANCAGFIDLDRFRHVDRYMFYCVDKTFDNIGKDSWLSEKIIAKELKVIWDFISKPEPSSVRLSYLAAYYASLIADEVILLHKSGEYVMRYNPVTMPTRSDFMKWIIGQMSINEERLSSKISGIAPSSSAGADRLVVFGGDQLRPALMQRNNPTYGQGSDNENLMTVVNLRANSPKVEVVAVTPTRKIKFIQGFDVAEHFGNFTKE